MFKFRQGWKNEKCFALYFDLPRVSRLAVAEVWLRCCQPHTLDTATLMATLRISHCALATPGKMSAPQINSKAVNA